MKNEKITKVLGAAYEACYEDEVLERLSDCNGNYVNASNAYNECINQLSKKYPDIIFEIENAMNFVRTMCDYENKLAYSIGFRDGVQLLKADVQKLASQL